MPSLIAAINMTLDGVCDHTAVTPDEEVHHHYARLIRDADAILYGRITYDLMRFWQDLAVNPSGDASLDEFAAMMDRIPKIVFSRTMTQVDWHSASLAKGELADVVAELKRTSSKDIFVGCRSLIIQCLDLGLLDELQIMVHPVIAGGGQLLFESPFNRIPLTLTSTQTFGSGAVLLTYSLRTDN